LEDASCLSEMPVTATPKYRFMGQIVKGVEVEWMDGEPQSIEEKFAAAQRVYAERAAAAGVVLSDDDEERESDNEEDARRIKLEKHETEMEVDGVEEETTNADVVTLDMETTEVDDKPAETMDVETSEEGRQAEEPFQSPVKVRKLGSYGKELLLETPKKACTKPINHQWDEIPNGSYVECGVLAGGKVCVGKKGDGICGKLMSATAVRGENNKMIHDTETIFHPTRGNPAWSCRECLRAMCNSCKVQYEINERTVSPGRKGGR
jgi:hypothetical protein